MTGANAKAYQVSGLAKAVYVEVTSVTSTTTPAVIFVNGRSASGFNADADGSLSYYTYNVMDNGQSAPSGVGELLYFA